ncbi:MAG: type III-B CRISPR module RAMP protein Cmr1 [Armatimonadetes bacterium]|nr:type III-B CRISPR module RAMP protein Cmr1 [Armatimonadota bacterium]MDW8028437.1 type III-B CRISPR module RAMP protein Cmr1 [Armatimonadota bacterium]
MFLKFVPPSFRGVMRFWLRALLVGILDDNPQEIFKRERAVFGSTEHASPVVVRVNRHLPRSIGYSGLTANKTGLAYLLFGARGTRTEPERTAVPVGQTLELTFQLCFGFQEDLSLKATYASLWLLTRFGDFGSRSRLSGGNLQVHSVQGDVPSSLPSLQVGAKTPSELQKELVQDLSQLRQWSAETFNGSLQPKFNNQPNFDVLNPKFCKIWVVDIKW